MKKIFLTLILLLCVVLIGCDTDKVVSIEAEDIYGCIDNFNITNYSFKVVYEDREETKQMSLELFSSVDQNKFYEIGTHQVVLSYEGYEKTINVTIEERKAIEIIANPSSVNSYLKEFEYEMVSLDIKFNDGTTETYPLSKEFLDNKDIISLGKPGTYDIEVTYESASTIIHFELLPNEIKIEELTQEVIIYCITTKVNDKYESVFYALGNQEFSGLQFSISKGSNVSDITLIKKSENTTVVTQEDNYSVMFVSSKNLTGKVELFTLSYTANNQYRNFNVDYNFDTKVVYIYNSEVKEVNNYLITLTR